ncbi:hypothetical protein [Lacinutrix salivirga]
MKFLKITAVAIFSIALLASFTQTEQTTNDTNNHEVKKVHIDLTAMKDKKAVKLPTQG